MSVEVGEGHIDIEPRVNDSSFLRQTKSMQAASQKMWDGYAKSAQKSIAESDRQMTASSNKHISSFQSLEKQRVAAYQDSNKRIQGMRDDIARKTAADRRLSDAAEAEGARAAKAFETEHMKSFSKITDAYKKGITDLEKHPIDSVRRISIKMRQEVERDSDRFGNTIGRNLASGFDAALSILPGRLERLITGSGPIGYAIGVAAGTAFVHGFAVVLPAIGAMISGALFASIGVGAAIAAAFVAAKDDPRVQSAANQLAVTFMNRVVYAPEMQNLGKVLADQLDKVTAALDRWVPHINSILQAGARFLGPITDGLIGMVDAILPALDRLTNSPFMKDIMDIFSTGLITIGDAFGDSFDNWLADPNAQEGAKKGLVDLFDLVAATIRTVFELLKDLSSAWEDLHKDPDGPGPMLSQIENIKENLKAVIGLFKQLGGVLPGRPPDEEKDDDTARGRILRGEIPDGKELFRKIFPPIAAKDLYDAGMFDGFINDAKSTWKRFREDLNSELGVARNTWNTFSTWFSEGWGKFFTNLGVDFSQFKETFGGSWDGFLERLRVGSGMTWENIKTSFVSVWQGITTLAIGFWSGLSSGFAQFGEAIALGWNSLGNRLVTGSVATWNAITGFVSGAWGRLQLGSSLTATAIGDFFQGGWNRVFQGSVNTWNAITGFIESMWNRLIQGSINTANSIWATIQAGWDRVLQGSVLVWNNIVGFVEGMWNRLIQGSVKTWDNIKLTVSNAINDIIGFLNSGIQKINELLGKIGVSHKIPEIGKLSTPAPAQRVPTSNMATGGMVRGPGTTTSDSIPARLSRDEFVLRAKSAKQLGYQNLDYMNRFGKVPGFAVGGRVGGGNNGLLEAHRDHVHVAMAAGFQAAIAAAAAAGIPFRVTSTLRPGDTVASGGLSHHATGKAVDFGGFNQDRLAGFFRSLPGVIELIHRTGLTDYAIFGGKSGGGGTGISGFLADLLGKGIDHFLNPITSGIKKQIPDSPFGFVAEHGVDKISEQVKKWVDEFMTFISDTGAPTMGKVGGGAKQWTGVATAALGRLGLPMSWLGPLLNLIQRESGGNPGAQNNWDSNAAMGQASRGLMQTIPSTFAAHRDPSLPNNIFDPLANITAGLRYIVARYGSIFNVQQAVGSTPRGYDSGGYLPTGLSTVYNGTGKPEAVLTGSQWDSMANGGDVNVTVLVDGVEVASRTIVERNNQELASAMRRGRGRR